MWSDLPEQLLCRIFRKVKLGDTDTLISKVSLRDVCQSWRCAFYSPDTWHDTESNRSLRDQPVLTCNSNGLKRRILAGGLENMTSLKLKLAHNEGRDWDPIFWHICKCQALKELHIEHSAVPSEDLLEWLIWGPANLEALQKFTLHAEWEADYDTSTLFGKVIVPPTCVVHIHVSMEGYTRDEASDDVACVPPIAYGLAKQLKSLHVVLQSIYHHKADVCVQLERLASCELLSHATFEVQIKAPVALTVSIQNLQQAPDCLQSIDIHIDEHYNRQGRAPHPLKLNHDGWELKRQAATDKQRQFELVRK